MVGATMDSARAAKASVWTGRVLSGLLAAFMIMDGIMKFIHPKTVTETTAQLGWPNDTGTLALLGSLILVPTLLYLIPRTTVFGAVLLTGYLGGAVATHARIGSPLFTHTLFGVYLGVMLWGGLWLRSPKLRAIFPIDRT